MQRAPCRDCSLFKDWLSGRNMTSLFGPHSASPSRSQRILFIQVSQSVSQSVSVIAAAWLTAVTASRVSAVRLVTEQSPCQSFSVIDWSLSMPVAGSLCRPEHSLLCPSVFRTKQCSCRALSILVGSQCQVSGELLLSVFLFCFVLFCRC